MAEAVVNQPNAGKDARVDYSHRVQQSRNRRRGYGSPGQPGRQGKEGCLGAKAQKGKKEDGVQEGFLFKGQARRKKPSGSEAAGRSPDNAR